MKANSIRTGIFFLVLATTMILSAACGESTPAAPAAGSSQEMFMNNCAKCHGLKGLGDGPSVGALRTQAGLNLTITASKSDDELYKTISSGKGSDMPPWELVLTKEQRLDLIKYIRTLAVK
ncbi:MAG: cytochrome c [Chloroflexi bacterium]|nr:cytochrome c [Chloroflexota bacterium]MBI5054084.1 cytochrome c [Chloroflexota bacterium]MBI5348827.1 cytochrome c [Chloroflexota bacterium]MBI5714996.1 cytochrome c [Chloroflexota bacterium]